MFMFKLHFSLQIMTITTVIQHLEEKVASKIVEIITIKKTGKVRKMRAASITKMGAEMIHNQKTLKVLGR